MLSPEAVILHTGSLPSHSPSSNNPITFQRRVWGVGQSTADRWFTLGHRTIDDLRAIPNLSEPQQIGLKYFEDFQVGVKFTVLPGREVHGLGIPSPLRPCFDLTVISTIECNHHPHPIELNPIHAQHRIPRDEMAEAETLVRAAAADVMLVRMWWWRLVGWCRWPWGVWGTGKAANQSTSQPIDGLPTNQPSDQPSNNQEDPIAFNLPLEMTKEELLHAGLHVRCMGSYQVGGV